MTNFDFDVQGDEFTQPSIDTHCIECGFEFKNCDCDTEENVSFEIIPSRGQEAIDELLDEWYDEKIFG
jgi:hypothetical protein